MTDRFFLARIGKGQELGIVERGTPYGNALWLKVPDRALPFAKKVVRRLNGESLLDIQDNPSAKKGERKPCHAHGRFVPTCGPCQSANQGGEGQ